MAQFVYTMNRVGKVVPPKREILKDISLSFFPGAKIGVLGLNGAGKSTLLRIMAGLDTEINGEARPQPGIRIGYLPQEPELDEELDVRGSRNAMPKDFEAVIAHLESGAFPLEDVVTRTVSVDKGPKALEAWSEAPGEITKIHITFD